MQRFFGKICHFSMVSVDLVSINRYFLFIVTAVPVKKRHFEKRNNNPAGTHPLVHSFLDSHSRHQLFLFACHRIPKQFCLTLKKRTLHMKSLISNLPNVVLQSVLYFLEHSDRQNLTSACNCSDDDLQSISEANLIFLKDIKLKTLCENAVLELVSIHMVLMKFEITWQTLLKRITSLHILFLSVALKTHLSQHMEIYNEYLCVMLMALDTCGLAQDGRVCSEYIKKIADGQYIHRNKKGSFMSKCKTPNDFCPLSVISIEGFNFEQKSCHQYLVHTSRLLTVICVS